MIVLLYNGHLGFQPLEISHKNPQSFYKPHINTYINNKKLTLPITNNTLIDNDVCLNGKLNPLYQISEIITSQQFEWSSEGVSVITHHKNSETPYVYSKNILDLSLMRFLVLCVDGDFRDAEVLTAALYSDATFKQIDDMCCELAVGGMCPFIWTPLEQIAKLVDYDTTNVKYCGIFQIRSGSISISKININNLLFSEQH